MQNDYQIKARLMLFGLENDYFAYGTIVEKRKDGKYKIIADGETYYNTLHQLADEWDQLDKKEQTDIIDFWIQSNHK